LQRKKEGQCGLRGERCIACVRERGPRLSSGIDSRGRAKKNSWHTVTREKGARLKQLMQRRDAGGGTDMGAL